MNFVAIYVAILTSTGYETLLLSDKIFYSYVSCIEYYESESATILNDIIDGFEYYYGPVEIEELGCSISNSTFIIDPAMRVPLYRASK